MPLSDGYGVVIGTVISHYIEPPDAEGRWPHYVINVATPAGNYECVINLKSRTEIKIEYKDFRSINRSYFENILAKPDGFHPLSSDSLSGALDVIRHNGLKNPYCCFSRWYPWLFFWKRRCNCTKWWKENGTDVINLMEYYLQNTKRIYIWGEPYTNGLGIHNIHMNQGDPIGSSFSVENGIWQDGGVMIEYTTDYPRISVFLTKFETQSLQTGSDGKPI